MIHTSYSVLETKTIAKEILPRLGGGNIILLSGPLGSGKTVITQTIAEELGIKENLTSPTYVLMKIYNIEKGKYKRLVHVDLYRIEYNISFDDMGLSDYLNDLETLIIIEWPEKSLNAWPVNAFKINVNYGDKSTIRTIDF